MINGGMKYLQKAMDTEFDNGVYKVQCGAFRYYHNAEELQKLLLSKDADINKLTEKNISQSKDTMEFP